MKKELDFQISESKKFARSSSFSLPTVSRYIKSLDVLCLEDHDAERQAASLPSPGCCLLLLLLFSCSVVSNSL